MGVRARREGNTGFELVRHLVLAAVLLREVLAHRVGWHSELAQRALDGLCACVAGAGQRHRTTVQELSTPAAPVTVAHPVRARRREHAVRLGSTRCSRWRERADRGEILTMDMCMEASCRQSWPQVNSSHHIQPGWLPPT